KGKGTHKSAVVRFFFSFFFLLWSKHVLVHWIYTSSAVTFTFSLHVPILLYFLYSCRFF
ncbi:hypothetical protein QBC46DRAFT_388254, partial [Diplogelasinospora grovesii]